MSYTPRTRSKIIAKNSKCWQFAVKLYDNNCLNPNERRFFFLPQKRFKSQLSLIISRFLVVEFQ